MARPRSLPPAIRPRGKGYVYDWWDATDKTISREAGRHHRQGDRVQGED
jgi:hypothetical protein